MDNTTISLNLENLNKEERKLLMSLVEKGNKPKSKVWKPEDEQIVYRILADGEITTFKYFAQNGYCINIYNIGNIFPTPEAAKEELKRRKILKRWKDLSIESGEEENPWDGRHNHWYISYGISTKRLVCYSCANEYYEGSFFASKESLQAAVKEIGEDNVKKYILNIKE